MSYFNNFRQIALHLKDSVTGLCALQSQLSEKVDCVQQKVEELYVKMPPNQRSGAAQYRQCSHSTSLFSYYDQPTKLSDYSILKTIGILGTISSSSCDNEKSNAISLTVLIPWLLGSKAFMAQFLLKSSLGCSIFKSQLSRGLLSVRNVVPDESKIMVACERGDVPVVQQLFESKTASPYDITRVGRTPLLVSF